MTFAEMFAQQLNNPECSILSGMMMGSWLQLKNLIILAALFLLFKALSRVFDRVLNKVFDYWDNRHKKRK